MISKLFNTTCGRSTAANEALHLALGAAGGQTVVLALSPVLTRIFRPEEIGVLGVFTGSVAVLSVIAPLGYEQAILGARHRSEAFRFLAAAIMSGIALSILLPSAGYLIANLIGHPLGPWFMAPILAVGTIPAIVSSSAQGWYIRERSIKTVGISSFVNLAGRTVLQIVSGFLGAGVVGLIGGEIAGRLLALVVLDRHNVLIRAFRTGLRYPGAILHQMRIGHRFALYQMPSSALDTILAWLPLPLVAFTYGAEWAGIVTLIQRIGTAPASLIGQSLVQIYHHRAALYVNTDRPALLRITLRLVLLFTMAFLPVWLLLIAFAPALFGFVFGEIWRPAGTVAAIWAPSTLLQIFGQIASRLLILVNRQVVRLVANIAQIGALLVTIATAAGLGYTLPIALGASISFSAVIYGLFMATALYHYRR